MAGFDRSYVVAHGAYGREVNMADWLAGLDFKIVGGPYFSIRDIAVIKADGIKTINFVNDRGFTVFVKNFVVLNVFH